MKTKYNNSYLYKALPKDYIICLKKHKLFKQFMKTFYNKVPVKVLILSIVCCNIVYENKLDKIKALLCSILRYYIYTIEKKLNNSNFSISVNMRITICISQYLVDYEIYIARTNCNTFRRSNNSIDGTHICTLVIDILYDMKIGRKPTVGYKQDIVDQYELWFQKEKELC